MKLLALLLLASALTGCSTRLYDPRTGRLLAVFQGDMTDSEYSCGDTRWKVRRVSHSTATRAGGSVVGTTGTAVAGVVTALATKGL